MSVHNGKIGRLPRDLRELVNLRLLDGEPDRIILPWLNALPVVQAILTAQFGGQPVNKANLSHWRNGGYRRWATERERFAFLWQLAQTSPAPSDPVKPLATKLS